MSTSYLSSCPPPPSAPLHVKLVSYNGHRLILPYPFSITLKLFISFNFSSGTINGPSTLPSLQNNYIMANAIITVESLRDFFL